MDVVAAYFERFNAKQLEGMADLFGPGYTYAGPLVPEPQDAAGHVALMRQIVVAQFAEGGSVQLSGRAHSPVNLCLFSLARLDA